MNTLSNIVKLAARAVAWGALVLTTGTVMFLSVWAYYFAFGGGL